MNLSPERADLLCTQSFVDGRWIDAADGRVTAVTDPATGELICYVPDCTPADATPYGLAAYFYSRDIDRIWYVAEAIEAGMVAVNDGALSTEVAPFGGIKESGYGREGSQYGLDEYLNVKYIRHGSLPRRVTVTP